jgi:hypothetical protein
VPVAARTAAVTHQPPRQCRGSGTTHASRGPAAGGRGGE